MEPNPHPVHGPVVIRDEAAGVEFSSNSTLAGRRDLPTPERADGGTRPSSTWTSPQPAPPFWPGNARVLDTEGWVEEFRRRYGRG